MSMFDRTRLKSDSTACPGGISDLGGPGRETFADERSAVAGDHVIGEVSASRWHGDEPNVFCRGHAAGEDADQAAAAARAAPRPGAVTATRRLIRALAAANADDGARFILGQAEPLPFDARTHLHGRWIRRHGPA